MQKITHEYKDYDGNTVVEDLYFNLRRDELAENLHLKDEFEAMQKITQEERREMSPAEVKRMFELIKELMRLTYGVRAGEDNRKFLKGFNHPEIWENFYEAAVYDSFIFWLFEDVKRANDFMEGLMPAQIREDAAKLAAEGGANIENYTPPTEIVKEPEQKKTGRKKRDVPSHEELLEMFRKQQLAGDEETVQED